MYKSAIDIIYKDIQYQMEENIFKAIQNVDINVNREELIKALKYDRDQYNKGYEDAKREMRNKDVPMMVTDDSGDCPACHADDFYTMYDMMDSDHYNYCANCGQRLDWTEYNKKIGLHIIKLEKKDNDN